MSERSEQIIELFNPDEAGVSRWVSIDEIVSNGIPWSKNGAGRHGVFFGIKNVIWLTIRKNDKPTGTILFLKMDGLTSAPSWQQNITARVKKSFENVDICNLSLLRIPEAQRNIDHRYGNKTHPDYIRLYLPENQKAQDFQIMFSVLNNAKREVCKRCCESGERPPHPTLGYASGDKSHNERYPCEGCFLAEPEKFRKK